MNDTSPKYFAQIPIDVMSSKEINSTDKLVFADVYTMLNVTSKCFMSNAKIAEDVGLKPKTVSKSITKLSKIGLLNVKLIYKENTKQVDKRYITLQSHSMPQLEHRVCPNQSIGMPQLEQDNKSLNRSLNRLSTNMSSSDEHDCSSADVIKYLNEKAGRKFRNTPANAKLINARIKEGFKLDDFKTVINNKVSEWKNDPTMQKYIRPITLFTPSKFEGYLNEQPKQQGKENEYGGLF